MARDEERTLAELKQLRQAVIDPVLSRYRGRIVKTMGDGLLVDFSSAVDAVKCAVEFQEQMARHNAPLPQEDQINWRLGIHTGDIMIDGDDIFGDGVNIAARLEGLSAPGGVCISDDTFRQIRAKSDVSFEDGGIQNLKNIAEPMQVWKYGRYRVRTSTEAGGTIRRHHAGGAIDCRSSIRQYEQRSRAGIFRRRNS